MATYLPTKPFFAAFMVWGLVSLFTPSPAYADAEGLMQSPLSIPRETVTADAPVDMADIKPLVLSEDDTKLYSKIFAAHLHGNSGQAEALSKKVHDRSLVDWARVRQNAHTSLWLPQAAAPRIYRSNTGRDKAARIEAYDLKLSIGVLLKTDDIARSEGVVNRALNVGTIDRIEAAQMRAQIAAAYLYAANPQKALATSRMALQVGGVVVPEAAWIAGLSSWMLKDYASAGRYFAVVPRSIYAGPWLRSASAYWTARSLMRQGAYKNVSGWLQVAARSPRSFYGLIATRALGTRFDFDWTVPPLTQKHLVVLKKYPGAVRALKLAQAGQMDMARLELALLDDAAAPQWREALAALAVHALKPNAAMKVAGILQTPQGNSIDMALYPVAPWKPSDGYRLDPALIHAFVRQESGFRPDISNKDSGATGLLQLMPRTARSVGGGSASLKDPETSMALGQKYLETLLDRWNGNLFDAAIAYNAGPTNLATWRKRFADVDDALLFIELVPFRETRDYVERVMANYWIYSLRMGTGVASLNAVVAGAPARYAGYDAPRPTNVYAAISANNR